MKPASSWARRFGSFRGVFAWFRLLLGAPVDWQQLHIPGGVWTAVACLMAVGLVRNGLEIAFRMDFDGHWFSWAPDITFTMAVFPVFLCFYGAGWLWILTRRHVPVDPQLLYGAVFYTQVIHLVIPPVDWVGNIWLGLPSKYYVAPYISHPFYSRMIVMTSGIILAWLITLRVFWVFLRTFQLSRGRASAVIFTAFNVLFWPIYILFPTFNTIFDWLAGLPHPSGLFYGYGMFFLLASLPGLWHWHRRLHAPIHSSRRLLPVR